MSRLAGVARVGVGLGLGLAVAAGCSTGSGELPGALFGTWSGGNSSVSSVRFSDGGRVELNGGECSGEYLLSAVDGSVGKVRSGYIQCPGVMDGYFEATVEVDGDSLNVDGTVINGNYDRD
jgi:hypothetical protein